LIYFFASFYQGVTHKAILFICHVLHQTLGAAS
jgi:hypothetical protein